MPNEYTCSIKPPSTDDEKSNATWISEFWLTCKRISFHQHPKFYPGLPLLISGRSNLVKSHHCSRYVVLAMLLATADCPSPITAPGWGEDKESTLQYLPTCFHYKHKSILGLVGEGGEEAQLGLKTADGCHLSGPYLEEKPDMFLKNNSTWNYIIPFITSSDHYLTFTQCQQCGRYCTYPVWQAHNLKTEMNFHKNVGKGKGKMGGYHQHRKATQKRILVPGCLCTEQCSLGESISSSVQDLLPNKTPQKEASSREEAATIQLTGQRQ